MQIPSGSRPQITFWIFLSLLVVLAMVAGFVATATYGAGVAADSVKYLAVAQSLLAGDGLKDNLGRELLSWPPLYPIVLAGISLVTRLDVFIAGWYFNIVLLGVNLFLSGVIFHRVFRERPLYAYLATLFVLTSVSSLRIHATISADPLYLTLTLGFLLAVDVYITRRSFRALAWMLIFGALAPMQRYVGMAVAVTGGIVILIENWRSPRVWLRDGLLLGLFSVLPIGWWIVGHNIMTYGTLWGTGEAVVDPLRNTSLALTKILHFFVPYHPAILPVLTRPWIPIAIVALILVLLNWKSPQHGRDWLRQLSAPSTYPMMIYGIVYFAAVALTILTDDHRDLLSDRYYMILLVQTAVFFFITVDTLVLPHLGISGPRLANALVLVFAFWLIYPLVSMGEYILKSRNLGEPTYNMYNSKTYQEMDAVAEMLRIQSDQPGSLFYSNYVDAVWFYTRTPVALLPFAGSPDPAAAYAGWPFDKPGYIVWFEPNEYKHYMSPKEIAKFAELELVFQGRGGRIYYVRAR